MRRNHVDGGNYYPTTHVNPPYELTSHSLDASLANETKPVNLLLLSTTTTAAAAATRILVTNGQRPIGKRRTLGGWAGKQANERTDRPTGDQALDRPTDRPTSGPDGRTDGRTCRQAGGRASERTSKRRKQICQQRVKLAADRKTILLNRHMLIRTLTHTRARTNTRSVPVRIWLPRRWRSQRHSSPAKDICRKCVATAVRHSKGSLKLVQEDGGGVSTISGGASSPSASPSPSPSSSRPQAVPVLRRSSGSLS